MNKKLIELLKKYILDGKYVYFNGDLIESIKPTKKGEFSYTIKGKEYNKKINETSIEDFEVFPLKL